MPATDNEDNDNDPHDRVPIDMSPVELHHCGPGRADQPEIGEPIAIITFVCDGETQKPLMLSLRNARRLLAKLAYVLAHFEDALAWKLMAMLSPSGEWPTDSFGTGTAKDRLVPRFRAKPSLRATMPSQPVRDTDVWRMVRMLQNVNDHETFMRLIGVSEDDILAKPQGPNVEKAPRRDRLRKKKRAKRR